MEGSTLKRDFLLGLVFFGTVVLLVYYTISLTGFSLSEKSQLQVFFPNASGLKEGDSVLINGRPSGTVRAVDLQLDAPDDERIRVTAELDQPLTLREGYLISITEFTLLGGRAIEILPGSITRSAMPSTTQFKGTVAPSALASLAELVEENREDVNIFLENMRRASDQIVSGEGVIGGLLYDEGLRGELNTLLDDAAQLASDIREGKGTLGMLIEDDKVRDDIVRLVNNGAEAAEDLREITENIAVGRGTLGALLNDPELRDDTVTLVGNLTEVSTNLRRMIEEADQGRGLLGRVIADDELAADAAQFVEDLAELSRKLREGEGSLGQLIVDDEAYNELLSALKVLNAQLEDAREAQPITSFSQLLFGAF